MIVCFICKTELDCCPDCEAELEALHLYDDRTDEELDLISYRCEGLCGFEIGVDEIVEVECNHCKAASAELASRERKEVRA